VLYLKVLWYRVDSDFNKYKPHRQTVYREEVSSTHVEDCGLLLCWVDTDTWMSVSVSTNFIHHNCDNGPTGHTVQYLEATIVLPCPTEASLLPYWGFLSILRDSVVPSAYISKLSDTVLNLQSIVRRVFDISGLS
jgi:hypothetical protein